MHNISQDEEKIVKVLIQIPDDDQEKLELGFYGRGIELRITEAELLNLPFEEISRRYLNPAFDNLIECYKFDRKLIEKRA